MQAVVAGRLQMEGGDSSGAGRAAKQALEDVMDRQFYECGFELALESEASRVTEATAEGLKDQLHTTRQALEQTRQTLEQTLQALEQTLQTLVEAEAGRSRMELQVLQLQRQLDEEKAQQETLHAEIDQAQENVVQNGTSDEGVLGAETGCLTCCSRAALELLEIKSSQHAAADGQSREVLAVHKDAASTTRDSLRHFEAELGRMYADVQGLFRWNCAIQVALTLLVLLLNSVVMVRVFYAFDTPLFAVLVGLSSLIKGAEAFFKFPAKAHDAKRSLTEIQYTGDRVSQMLVRGRSGNWPSAAEFESLRCECSVLVTELGGAVAPPLTPPHKKTL